MERAPATLFGEGHFAQRRSRRRRPATTPDQTQLAYEAFKRKARQALAMGITRYSARAIFEVIRWEFLVDQKLDGDRFSLNNNQTKAFAQRLVNEDNRFADFFEFRSSKRRGERRDRPRRTLSVLEDDR